MKNINENMDLKDSVEESTDPDYLKWRDAKVQAALDELERDPSSLVPAHKAKEMLLR